KKERTTALVTQAVKAGFRGVDTACQPKHYREDLVGAAIKGVIADGIVKREDLWIQTKFTSIDGQDRSQPLPYNPALPVTQQVSQSIQKSLSNLGVEYIDSVILHSPLNTREQTLEAYRSLEAAVSEGKIGQLGVSNIYEQDELMWLMGKARVPVSVVQNRWYEGNGWDWDIYDICKANSIRYQSFWTLSGSPTLLRHPTLRALASKASMTPQQAVYKLCQLWGITPLCGSTDLQHIKEALGVENVQELSGDTPEVKDLWRLMRGEA
ncbi:hypothetical protein JCM24511_06300, partial [Saitozyma sp. JCM 24511]